jgi:site-specific DNA-methyltransferase (adenine-specific)
VDTGIGPPIPATVLDPFVGSGTTALVARKHGRRTIGIELNPAYCQIAERRTRQLSLLGDAA